MWTCKKCKEEVDDEYDVCWNCGSDRKGATAINIKKDKQKQFQSSEIIIEDTPIIEEEVPKVEKIKPKTKYPALITLSNLFVIFAIIAGVTAIVGIIYAFTLDEMGYIVGAISFVIGAMNVLILIAASELIKLFIDIEKNTRQASKRR